GSRGALPGSGVDRGRSTPGRSRLHDRSGPPDRGRDPAAFLSKGGVMQSTREAASAFLANNRVAVTGVSRTPKTHGSNSVYKRLRERGYEGFAVNPNADQVEDDT